MVREATTDQEEVKEDLDLAIHSNNNNSKTIDKTAEMVVVNTGHVEDPEEVHEAAPVAVVHVEEAVIHDQDQMANKMTKTKRFFERGNILS